MRCRTCAIRPTPWCTSFSAPYQFVNTKSARRCSEQVACWPASHGLPILLEHRRFAIAPSQEAKRKGPKDEADGLSKRLQRINESLDEANKKASTARSAAKAAQKEAGSLHPKYQDLQVHVWA